MNAYQGFLIYGLQDPISLEIRYIGRSSSGMKRPTEHLRPHKLAQKSHKSSWIKSLLLENLKPEVIILESFPDSSQLNEAEIKWITYYKVNGHRLTNHTEGGDGVRGWHHSDETKQKISNAFKGDKHPQWTGGLPKCMTCGTDLGCYSKTRILCRACRDTNQSGPKNVNWKGGKPNCLDCGKGLSTYKSKRCHRCATLSRPKTSSGQFMSALKVSNL